MNLKSSRIRSAEYNDSTEALTIEFVNGGKYKYFSVPESIYQELIKSQSPGKYFDQNIKPHFSCAKVSSFCKRG